MAETRKLELPVLGMSCAACATAVERTLTKKAAGVIKANVNIATETADIEYDPTQTDPQALAAAGRHSLDVFRTGLFLSWGMTVALRLAAGAWWLDPTLTLAGVAILLGQGMLIERRRLVPALVPR